MPRVGTRLAVRRTRRDAGIRWGPAPPGGNHPHNDKPMMMTPHATDNDPSKHPHDDDNAAGWVLEIWALTCTLWRLAVRANGVPCMTASQKPMT